MDYIDKAITNLRNQITTMHNNAMNRGLSTVQSAETVELNQIKVENQILKSRIIILEAKLKDYQETNEELADQCRRLLKREA